MFEPFFRQRLDSRSVISTEPRFVRCLMRMRVLSTSALVSLALVLTPLRAQQTGPAQSQSSRISLEQYFDLEDVQDPRLSPDGKQIISTPRWVAKVNAR